ncbi:hypothetical protein AUP68_00991 [Ilyonectria robusta]
MLINAMRRISVWCPRRSPSSSLSARGGGASKTKEAFTPGAPAHQTAQRISVARGSGCWLGSDSSKIGSSGSPFHGKNLLEAKGLWLRPALNGANVNRGVHHRDRARPA